MAYLSGPYELTFLDSFDHYTVAEFDQKGWAPFTEESLPSLVPGRIGGQAVAGLGGLTSVSRQLLSGPPLGGVTVGVAFNLPSYLVLGSAVPITVSGPSDSAGAGISSIGLVTFQARGQTATSTVVANAGTWYYLEYQVAFLPEAVDYVVSLNGQIVLEGTFTTSMVSNPGINTIAATAGMVDDLYVASFVPMLLGDTHVQCLYPAGVGTYSQWTPSASGANWQMVNSILANQGETFVATVAPASGSSGAMDTYLMTQLPANANVVALQAVIECENASGAEATISPVYDLDGDIVDDTLVFSPALDTWVFMLDPEGYSVFSGDQWSYSEINGMQFGQVAGSGS